LIIHGVKEHFRENPIAADIGVIILLAITAFCCTLPLFIHRSLLVSHDINFHIFQANEFYKCLSSGSFFPQWALDANNGYGSANFIFYSPLSYYIVAAFHLFIPSIIHSIIAAIWFSFFLSGITMFFAIRKILDYSTGLLFAILYQVLPFHIFNLYLRGSLAELFAYIWFPLIIYFLSQMSRTETEPSLSAGLGISYSCLILTHLVSAFLFTIVITVFLIYLLFSGGSLKKILMIAGSLVIGLGLSSIYLLPVVYERKFVQIGYIFEYAFSNFRKNFLFLPDNLHGMPGRFYIPVHIAVILELLLFLLIISRRYAKSREGTENMQFGFFALLFLFSFFMTTPLSGWLWELSHTLQTIQFPWRWVSFMELSLLFLIVDFFMKEKGRSLFSGGLKTRSSLYVLITLVLLSAITAFNGNRNVPEEELSRFLHPEKAGYYTNQPKEYTPVWATDLEKLLKRAVPERVTVLSGKATTKILEWQPEKRMIDVDASTPAELRMATFYYPGWRARLDGGKARIGIENNTGEMLVTVPKGRHKLDLQFTETPLRRFAKYLSLVSCILVVMFAAAPRLRKKTS
jgi:hypothetical protein